MTAPSIVEFLHARIQEDEDTARAARDLMDEPWKVFPEGHEEENYSGGHRVSNGGTNAGWVEESKAFHIARHDPARVLREVAAKRRIMERHKPDDRIAVKGPYRGRYSCQGCNYEYGTIDEVTQDINECPELRDLAAVYSGHKDFNPEWRA